MVSVYGSQFVEDRRWLAGREEAGMSRRQSVVRRDAMEGAKPNKVVASTLIGRAKWLRVSHAAPPLVDFAPSIYDNEPE
jgi:hypothetical protein